ncbi:hypothetical protein [Sphaerimonospora thailandensis]|uniref:Uncharacterized protein n=1 Tax=Sphaerimonospora thailandensis TaxID=795644 RepID=A0A8J3VZP4_9ACTN|nr:hypothetical protein [Sphaerimonospora thailandensis]GIH70081.1 hypothetical protein Mth01_23340 [Sphaerimonospora thailandensis]
MVKRVATALVAAALGTATLATSPAYAAHPTPTPSSHHPDSGNKSHVPDPRILSVDVSPSTVVVGRHGSVRVTATVRTKDVQSVSIELRGPSGRHGGDHGRDWLGKKGGQHGKHDRARYDVASRSWTLTSRDRSGQWKVHVEAVGVDGRRVTADRGFEVKRDRWRPRPPKGPKATRIVDFTAKPDQVRRGREITLQGKLQVAQCYSDWYYRDWNSHSGVHNGNRCEIGRASWHDWNWLGYQDIGVYFRPSGSHRWKYVDTLKTNRDGGFSTRVRAYRSGTWAVKFDGNGRLKGSEASDSVRVGRW